MCKWSVTKVLSCFFVLYGLPNDGAVLAVPLFELVSCNVELTSLAPELTERLLGPPGLVSNRGLGLF